MRGFAIVVLLIPAAASAADIRLLLAAPRSGGRIVVVEDDIVHASDDQGVSFYVLHRVGPAEGIYDATVGADGTLYALRGSALDIVRVGRTTSRTMHDALRVAVSGSVVAVLETHAVELSTDGGSTFVSQTLPAPCLDCDDRLDGMVDFTVAGGSAFLVDTEINTCGSSDLLEWQRLVQVTPTSTFQRTIALRKADFAAHWSFGAFGWIYGVTYADRVVAISASGAEPVQGLGAIAPGDHLDVAHNGRVTIATLGSALIELNGAHARVLDAHPKPATLLAVDGDDRPLVTDGKELWRFSRVTGWSRLSLP